MTRTPSWRVGAAAVGAALVVTSGCAVQREGWEARPPTVDAGAFPLSGEADYDVKSSAGEVAESSDLTVSGVVQSWSDGRAIREGSDTLARTAVLQIAVGRSAGHLDSTSTPTSIYVEVQRGDSRLDEAGHEVQEPPGEETQSSVPDLSTAAPVGSRVLFMGGPAFSDDAPRSWGGTLVQRWRPPAGGATLLSPKTQGLFLAADDGGYVSVVAEQRDVEGRGWPSKAGEKPSGDEFDQLVAEVL